MALRPRVAAFPILVAALLPAAARTPQGPRVVSVDNGGLLFTDNRAGVSGVDCGYSLPIGSRTLWFFGDVFLQQPGAPDGRYTGAVSNCALTVPAGTGSEPLRHARYVTDERGFARPVIPDAPGEGRDIRLWPFGSWYDASSHRAYLYYARVRVTGNGQFAFRTEGHGLARADTRRRDEIRFERLHLHENGGLYWPSDGPLFGNAVVAADGWLYLAGVQQKAGRKMGLMARVRPGQIEDLGAYEYFAGSGETAHWSKRKDDAGAVEGLEDFPSELTIAWNGYLGGYLAVHSVGISQKIRLSLGPHPWGPYRQIAEIGAPHKAMANSFCYAGKEHPELAEQGGRIIYLTYVDSDRYWLQLLRVTLER